MRFKILFLSFTVGKNATLHTPSEGGWQYLAKLHMHLLSDPAIPRLGIYSKDALSKLWKDISPGSVWAAAFQRVEAETTRPFEISIWILHSVASATFYWSKPVTRPAQAQRIGKYAYAPTPPNGRRASLITLQRKVLMTLEGLLVILCNLSQILKYL